MKTRIGLAGLLFACAAVFIPCSVNAADKAVKALPPANAWNWYVEARIALGILSDYDVSATGLGPGVYSPGSGFHAAFDAGVILTPNWRAEFEWSWSRLNGGTAYGLPHAGTVDAHTLLVNAHYTLLTGSAFRPFVGAGIGAQIINVNNLGAIGGAFVVNDTDVVFAGALHAGIDVQVMPNVLLTSRYTLLATSASSFGTVPPGTTVTKNAGVDNIITVGLRVVAP